MTSFNFSAIGTEWHIDIYTEISDKQELSIKNKVLSRIEDFDKTYSRFRKDSWVTYVSQKEGAYSIPDDFQELIDIYLRLYPLSGKRFTPLIGQILVDAGYDSNYSLKQKSALSAPPDFISTVELNDQEVIFHKKSLLDLGAAGKGYLVDIISNLFVENKIVNFCIDAGGDILQKNSINTLRIGLEHPDDSKKAIGIANIQNLSICGSAGNRRKWGEFHHTIDPITLQSPSNVKATWVVAKKTIIADALATCLFLNPEPQNYKDFIFDYVIMYKDNSAFISPGFPGALFTS